MNVPILTKRRVAREQAIEDAAMQKAIGAVGEALDWSAVGKAGAGSMMGNPGMGGAASLLSARANQTSWSNQSSMQSALIARVTQNLASGFQRAPEELEVSLAEQGMSWGAPFPPGRPLDPMWGYRRPPRTWDYAVGENVQLTPRWNRIPFTTIKQIWDSYDVAQICTRHLINDVRSLDYSWEPLPGVKEDVSEDIKKAEEFFDSPDKRQPFRAWLAEYLQDVIKYDAGALYVRQNMAGEPLALEVVSGSTIIPLVDFFGRRPEDETDTEDIEGMFDGNVVPAYVQIIEGLPWDWLAADDLIYQPWNPEPESQYGRAPLEAVLLSANTDIRFQWHFLQYFTEGTIPAGFMEAPPDQSDPAQIAHWQEVWDAVMQGDQSKKTQIRWVPSGSKFDAYKDEKFDSEFPLYLMRRTCAAHGITPNDLGFTENVNKSSGDTQIDVQFRVGTAPLLRHSEDVINLFTKKYLKLRCRLKFDDGRETEDRVATATAEGIYIDHGVISPDEPRQKLGYPIDKSRPMPRFINNTRSGPIPLLALESMSGDVDPETYAPSDAQEMVATPFSAAPGPIPAQGSPEAIAAAEHSAQAARDLVAATTGTPPAADDGTPIKPEEDADAVPDDSDVTPEVATKGSHTGGMVSLDLPSDVLDTEEDPHITIVFLGKDISPALHAAVIARAKEVAAQMAPLSGTIGGLGTFEPSESSDNKTPVYAIPVIAGIQELREAFEDFNASEFSEYMPHVTITYLDEGDEMPDAPARVPVAFHSLSVHCGDVVTTIPFSGAAKGEDNTGGPGVKGGLHASNAPQGIDVLNDDEEDDEDAIKAAYTSVALRRWKSNARNRLKKGMAPRRFVDPNLPQEVHDAVWASLQKAGTREEVDAAFAGVGRPKAPAGARPAFHSQAKAIVEHYTPQIQTALGNLFNAGAVDEAIKAAEAARPVDMDTAKKAAVWDKSEGELTAREWVYKDAPSPIVAARAAAVKALAAKASSSAELKQILYSLYGDSFLQGAHDAAEAAGGSLTTGIHGVTGMPDDYWDKWKPGYGDAAARVADGGMREMLDAADITIKGMTDTSIDRIGNTIAEGLASGDSYEATGKAVREMIADSNRADMIADTEYARANTEASMSTYRELEVEKKQFMAEADACPECQENEDAGDIPLDEEFPNGDVPVHPNCRCAIAPVIDLGGSSE